MGAAAPSDYLTALIALLKTHGGQDKLYKVVVNCCKLLLIHSMAAKGGAADKVQKALSECRVIMRLLGWLGDAKEIYTIAKAQKMSPAIGLELGGAVTGARFIFEDNLEFLHKKGVVTIDLARNNNAANFHNFWGYVFGALLAWFGKGGYVESVNAAKKAAAAGEHDAAKKANAKATKSLLKGVHHTLDTLANLGGMQYIPSFKPSPSFSPLCGLASGAIATYLQYNDQLEKLRKDPHPPSNPVTYLQYNGQLDKVR